MEDLDTIAREVLVCTLCPLQKSRTIAVPGEGPRAASLMFVGEAPGREEDLCGRPFVGRSGKVFDSALQSTGLNRNAAFVTSVVKCRPPQNRLPRQFELQTCIGHYLQRQIRIVDPRVICLLGLTAARALLGVSRLAEVRGTPIYTERIFFVTYHPAAAGRNPAWETAFRKDLRTLRELVEAL